MNKKEFERGVVNELNNRGLKAEVTEVVKENGRALTGIIVGDSVITPIVYIDRWEEEMTPAAAAAKIIDIAEQAPDIEFDVNKFNSFETVRDRLGIRIVNFERNREMLQDLPHITICDLAVFYVYLISDTASIKITNQLVEKWGITLEELDRVARENTFKILPGKVESLFQKLTAEFGMEMEGEQIDYPDDDPMKVISNSPSWGFAAILDPTVQEELLREKEEVFIIPSSVHEALCIDNNIMDPDAARDMILQVNTQDVNEEDFLSNNLYILSREGLRIA